MGGPSNFRVQTGITTTSVSNVVGLNITDNNTVTKTDISFTINDLTINNKLATGKIFLKTNNTTAVTINADGSVVFANGITGSIPTTNLTGTILPTQLGVGTANSTTYLRGDNTWQTLSKSAVGLGNVENTALSTWPGSVNLTTAGSLTATSLTVTDGNIYLNNTTTNSSIIISSTGVNPPSKASRSSGTRVVCGPGYFPNTAEFALGLETGALWFSTATMANSFKWYGAETLAATLTGSGDLTITGTARASTFISTSDFRLKTDIKTISNPIDTVKQLSGKTFKMIPTNKQSMGVIAQELEPIIPYLVETDQYGLKAVNYSAMIGLLIEAIKEQQLKIDQLEQCIKS